MSGGEPGNGGHKGHLEVVAPQGRHCWRHPLDGNHHLIGRSPKATLRLDHSTVSRLHAELILGPIGHWWLHDLDSTNGTLVNGKTVTERMLSPGDSIGVGDYTLTFQWAGQRQEAPSRIPPPPGSMTSITIAGGGPPSYREPLSEVEPTVVTMRPDRREAPRISASHISTAMDLERQLMSVEDASARMKTLCCFMVGDDFPGDWAVVVRMRRDEQVRLVGDAVYRAPGFEPQHHISASVLESIWESRQPVLASSRPLAEPQAGIGQLSLASRERMIAVVACPLKVEDDRVDALYVELAPAYAAAEWLSLVTLIAEAFRQAELVWEVRHHARAAAAVERELEMARQIQEGLVPRAAAFEGLELAIGFQPCHWVGGDYVDAVAMPDGRLLVAIADVCGKGMQAALVASSLHTMVRARADTDDDLLMLAQRVNSHLCRYLPDHSFVTMLCLAIDPQSGQIECVNAGHPPALVADRRGKLRKLQSEQNTALGIIDARFEPQHAALGQGEAMLVYTDGLTELVDENRRQLGEDRLGQEWSAIVAADPDAPVDELQRKLTEMLERYRGSQLATDDSAFLVARWPGPAQPAADAR